MPMPLLDPVSREIPAVDGKDLAQLHGFCEHDERGGSQIYRVVGLLNHQRKCFRRMTWATADLASRVGATA